MSGFYLFRRFIKELNVSFQIFGTFKLQTTIVFTEYSLNTCIGNKHNDNTKVIYYAVDKKSQYLQFKVDSSNYITSMYNHSIFRGCKPIQVCHN